MSSVVLDEWFSHQQKPLDLESIGVATRRSIPSGKKQIRIITNDQKVKKYH